MKNNNSGFTLVELAISIAVTGVIAVSALGSYKYIIPKIQFSESLKMMDSEVPNVLSANAISACTVTGANQTIKGKYGVLTVAGTYKKVSGQSCPAGCTLTYKFNATDVSKKLAGKTVAANVTAGGQLSKTSATNVNALFVPGRFKAIATASGDSCTTLADGSLTVTNGTLSGTDRATTAAVPTNPLTPTEPSGTITPPPYDYNDDYMTGELFCYAYNSGRGDYGECIIVSKDRKKQLAHVAVSKANMDVNTVIKVMDSAIPSLRTKTPCMYTPNCTTTIMDIPSNWDLSNDLFLHASGKAYRLYN